MVWFLNYDGILMVDNVEKLPIVFLHGWGMDSRVWHGVADRFGERHRIVTIDLPGYGGSCAFGGDHKSLADVAAYVVGVAPQRAIWVGWSLGGIVAQYIAVNYPERVRALSLLASTPRFVAGEDWPWAMDPVVFAGFYKALLADRDATLGRFVALQVKGSDNARETLRQLRSCLPDFGPDGLAVLAGGLSILKTANLLPFLRDIACPVQMVFGEHDRLVPLSMARAMQPLLADVRIDILSGAAHVPFISHRVEFLRVITEFLNGLAD